MRLSMFVCNYRHNSGYFATRKDYDCTWTLSTLFLFLLIYFDSSFNKLFKQAFSTLAHEAMFHARLLNIKTVFTDHSLFGFADASSILTNKILEYSIANCDHVICVSNTCRENTFLRANISDATKISVIPNAIDRLLIKLAFAYISWLNK